MSFAAIGLGGLSYTSAIPGVEFSVTRAYNESNLIVVHKSSGLIFVKLSPVRYATDAMRIVDSVLVREGVDWTKTVDELNTPGGRAKVQAATLAILACFNKKPRGPTRQDTIFTIKPGCRAAAGLGMPKRGET